MTAPITYQHEQEDCDGEWHSCWDCDGDGYVDAGCFEDSCCCLDPEGQHGVEPCRICDGRGGWQCPLLNEPR